MHYLVTAVSVQPHRLNFFLRTGKVFYFATLDQAFPGYSPRLNIFIPAPGRETPLMPHASADGAIVYPVAHPHVVLQIPEIPV